MGNILFRILGVALLVQHHKVKGGGPLLGLHEHRLLQFLIGMGQTVGTFFQDQFDGVVFGGGRKIMDIGIVVVKFQNCQIGLLIPFVQADEQIRRRNRFVGGHDRKKMLGDNLGLGHKLCRIAENSMAGVADNICLRGLKAGNPASVIMEGSHDVFFQVFLHIKGDIKFVITGNQGIGRVV